MPNMVVITAADGKRLALCRLKADPVWDSIAVANGQFYIDLADGTVQCLGR